MLSTFFLFVELKLHLLRMKPAFAHEVLWDAFRCPGKFGKPRMYFLVQGANALFEESTFFLWQSANNSVVISAQYKSGTLLMHSWTAKLLRIASLQFVKKSYWNER